MTEQKIKTDCNAADLNNQLKDITIEENLQARHGIQPYRMAILMKYAEKIISQLVNIPAWPVGYDDIEFVLELLLEGVQKARQKR